MPKEPTEKNSVSVTVCTVPGVSKRCRAGHLFGPEPIEVALGADQLAAVRGDVLLVVTDLPAKASVPSTAVGGIVGAGNKGMTPTSGNAGRG